MKPQKNKLNVQRSLKLADGHAQKNAFDLARATYGDILEKFPKNSRAIAGLNAVRQREARVQRPELTQAIVDQMFAMRTQGHLQEALAEARLLSTAHPHEAVLHNFLATCYFETSNNDAAREACKRALVANPDYPEAHLNMSIALRTSGQYAQALTHVQKAIKLRPAYVAAFTNQGLLLELMNQPERAIESLKLAVEMDPEYADGFNNLGGVYRFVGQSAKAAECFEKSLAINPNVAEVHCNLSDLKTYVRGDPQIQQMQDLLAKPGLDPDDRFPLGFALSTAFEDIGDLDQSFDTLLQANRDRKAVYPYDTAEMKWHFDAIKEPFADGKLSAVNRPVHPSEIQPIFIVGLPRSGTTLVEQIISSHSQVYGAGELDKIGVLMSRMVPSSPLVPAPEALSPENLARSRDEYLARLQELAVPEKIITDKMPLNFKWVGYLAAMFKDVRIVHIKRDPMATCWSMFKRRFASKGNGFAYDLDDLADYHALFEDLMEFWNDLVPDNILTVNYESLTQNQEAETRRLIGFLGLEWEDACLNFHQSSRSVRTASAEQVRQKMYTGSSQDWKKFERHLQPLAKRLKLGHNLV